MRQEAHQFIEFMRDSDVLVFGDFVTKSGRQTPYFINTGRYTTGRQMETLGSYYAGRIVERFGDRFDVLFGPAYKGIPLVVTTAIALRQEHGIDVPIAFNRKEAKDHGEGGVLVGHGLQDGERVLIVEDVTTAGTSIRETVPILRSAANVALAGLIVSVDRMETGTDPECSALEGVGKEFQMPTASIVTLDDLVDVLRPGSTPPGDDANRELSDAEFQRLVAYRAEFCVPKGRSDGVGSAN